MREGNHTTYVPQDLKRPIGHIGTVATVVPPVRTVSIGTTT